MLMSAEALESGATEEEVTVITSPLLPKLTIGICLTLKFISDPAEYDPARLQELRSSRLPDPEPVPDIYLAILRRSRPELAVRILEAQSLRIIPRPTEFQR